MLAECPPNRKLAITADMMNRVMRSMDPDDEEDVDLCLLFSFGYLGFLRLSELLNLKRSDVRVEANGITLNIAKSKTDQRGRGHVCYIERSRKSYDAYGLWYLYQVYHDLNDDPVFSFSQNAARDRIRLALTRAGVTDVKKYSTHSLRRGGAAAAARAGIQDNVIQRHGRWKSWCFTAYTMMERREAGRMITSEI